MAARCSGSTAFFLPFLYPSVHIARYAGHGRRRAAAVAAPASQAFSCRPQQRRNYVSEHTPKPVASAPPAETESDELYYEPAEDLPKYPASRLNPTPDDYAQSSFADKATLTLHAGPGGNGCISFLRDMFIPEGPANGGDGGHGGNIYIQAVPGETSLHKIARRRIMRAGRGKHGQGSSRGGTRGDDLIIQVPVGTVVTEVSRTDPVAEDAIIARERYFASKRKARIEREAAESAAAAAKAGYVEPEEDVEMEVAKVKSPEEIQIERQKMLEAEEEEAAEFDWITRKWLVYPGLSATEVKNIEYPKLPRRDRIYSQPAAPVYLDLSRPSPQPILLAVGGVGGLGNPHFVSSKTPRPVVATRGDGSVSMRINLELRLLADVGLVGLPNAGKSTLLRAVSNSRARVGSWAFTTLQPNIGTVVLDNNRGRPVVSMKPIVKKDADGLIDEDAEPLPPRTRFTIADIPGLIEGAHLDKGLGVEFLRHVERAGVLAFVIDLGAGDAIKALKALWNEVGLYARLREEEEQHRERESSIEWDNAEGHVQPAHYQTGALEAPVSPEMAIAGKPWFVVATKGDLPGAEDNFARLKVYMDRIGRGEEKHPSGLEGGWTKNPAAIPISAIHGHGIDNVVHWTVGLLDQ